MIESIFHLVKHAPFLFLAHIDAELTPQQRSTLGGKINGLNGVWDCLRVIKTKPHYDARQTLQLSVARLIQTFFSDVKIALRGCAHAMNS